MTNHPATSELRKPNIWPMWVPKTIPPHPKPQGGSHRLTDSPTVGIRLMAQFRASWFFWTLLIGLNWRWKNHQLYLQCFPIAVAVEAAGAQVVSESRWVLVWEWVHYTNETVHKYSVGYMTRPTRTPLLPHPPPTQIPRKKLKYNKIWAFVVHFAW